MVFGNPLKFAFLIEHIPMWDGDNQFKNGLFHYCINGRIFPCEVRVATLNVDIYNLLNSNAISSPVIDIDLYNMNKNDAY
ncbi:MAG: Imm42 family immunity protein [Limnobaculum xujianqingii]